ERLILITRTVCPAAGCARWSVVTERLKPFPVQVFIQLALSEWPEEPVDVDGPPLLEKGIWFFHVHGTVVSWKEGVGFGIHVKNGADDRPDEVFQLPQEVIDRIKLRSAGVLKAWS